MTNAYMLIALIISTGSCQEPQSSSKRWPLWSYAKRRQTL